MFAMPVFDVAGPGLILFALGASLGILLIVMLVIVVLEAVMLALLKWGGFGRSLLASLVMNLATTLVGFGVMVFMTEAFLLSMLVGFILSVLIEAGVLMLFKRGAARANWIAALVANAASYLLVLLPLFLILG